MTIEVTKHPYRELEHTAFVALREAPAFTNDDLWEQVLGMNIVLPGGTEVDVDGAELERALEDIEGCDHNWDEASSIRPELFAFHGSRSVELLVPVVANDIDLPPVRLLIRLSDLKDMFQQVTPGQGPNTRGGTESRSEASCSHPAESLGKHHCRPCMRRLWMKRAMELGVIDGGQ